MIAMASSEKETRNCSRSIPTEISVAEASSTFPGFRFSPTDEELIRYYLKKKLQGCNEAVHVIAELDICRYEPWDLPAHSVIRSENEWFFFSPRGRKYPNGSQSRRATESGYWKATGKERVIKSGSDIIGAKRTLVFHAGRAPRGQRTEWIMHEYTTSERSQDAMVVCRLRRNSEFHQHSQSHDSAVRTTNTATNSPRKGQSTPLTDGEVNVAGDQTLNNVSKECSSNSNTSHHSLEEQGSPGEDDFFADIMNDDIIKLDETPSILKHMSEVMAMQPNSSTSPHGTTANRRLKLRRKNSDDRIQVRRESEQRKDGPKKTERKLLGRVLYVLVCVVLVFLHAKVLLDLSSRRILK